MQSFYLFILEIKSLFCFVVNEPRNAKLVQECWLGLEWRTEVAHPWSTPYYSSIGHTWYKFTGQSSPNLYFGTQQSAELLHIGLRFWCPAFTCVWMKSAVWSPPVTSRKSHWRIKNIWVTAMDESPHHKNKNQLSSSFWFTDLIFTKLKGIFFKQMLLTKYLNLALVSKYKT